MGQDDLSNRSDVYLWGKLRESVSANDLCAFERIAAELRQRMRQLRVEVTCYHVDSNVIDSLVFCEAK